MTTTKNIITGEQAYKLACSCAKAIMLENLNVIEQLSTEEMKQDIIIANWGYDEESGNFVLLGTGGDYMGFTKGVSGNKKGRPKQSEQEKEQREQFKQLLSEATVSALESIIAIANSQNHREKLKACKYIIDKAYGANATFLTDNQAEPLTIKIVSAHSSTGDNNKWEDEEQWE